MAECRHRGEVSELIGHNGRLVKRYECKVHGACTFSTAIDRLKTCSSCSDRVAPSVTACVHRGEELRRIGCESCSGNVQIKILSCEIHGECTIGKPIDGVKCCAGCPDAETQSDRPGCA